MVSGFPWMLALVFRVEFLHGALDDVVDSMINKATGFDVGIKLETLDLEIGSQAQYFFFRIRCAWVFSPWIMWVLSS
jgi:hypothetical protein